MSAAEAGNTHPTSGIEVSVFTLSMGAGGNVRKNEMI